MKTIVTETALKTKFWSAAIRTVAYFLGNSFTVPQPRPININEQICTVTAVLLGGSQTCLININE